VAGVPEAHLWGAGSKYGAVSWKQLESKLAVPFRTLDLQYKSDRNAAGF
jgi:hypothetical protein